ncbi:Imm50 family immunity protein [Streptomyces sp. NPDC056431]|uniref:Imm50 family immunity protein n=1 Tax=Streptomyces sp. NPDC056431 TaxID=3345814 RepID=UPI003699C36A
MSTCEWADLLVDPRGIRDVFTTPPDLDECSLFYCHIDERGTSITLGFDIPLAPDALFHEDGDTKANAFEFFITFMSVTGLQISGWGGSVRRSVRMSRSQQDGDITLSVESPTERIAFQAQEAKISRARAYLAA